MAPEDPHRHPRGEHPARAREQGGGDVQQACCGGLCRDPAADVLLARAGAATVSEVAAVGLPAVFVPLPIGNGEQAKNASSLVKAGAALLVDDAALTAAWLESELIPLLMDQARLEEMAGKA